MILLHAGLKPRAARPKHPCRARWRRESAAGRLARCGHAPGVLIATTVRISADPSLPQRVDERRKGPPAEAGGRVFFAVAHDEGQY